MMKSTNLDVRQIPGYPYLDVRQIPGYPFRVPPPKSSNNDKSNHGIKSNNDNQTLLSHSAFKQGIRKIPVMEDLPGLSCVVCSRLAQYAVLTPCCSSLACRTCAIKSVISSQGKCTRCHASPVLLSSLVPHQQVRRKVEEIEVYKQVAEGELVDKNNDSLPVIKPISKRAFDHTNDDNKIESKRMNLDNFSHSGLKTPEGNDSYFPLQVSQAEVVKESIGPKINENVHSEITKTISLEKEKSGNKCTLEASVDKHSQNLNLGDQDAEQSKNGKETFTIKEQELEQLKQFIKYEKEKLNKIKLTFAEEEAKKMVKEKEALFKLVKSEQENARNIKRELVNKEEELEHLSKDFEDKCQQLKVSNENIVMLKKIGRNFRDKLFSAEEEIKKVLGVNKALYATIISLKEEKKKMEEKEQLKSTFKHECIGRNAIKEDLEQLKNKQLNFSNNNNAQLKKIAKENLCLAEEEIKWIFDERRTLDATIESLMEENEKLEQENKKLKSANRAENNGENGHVDMRNRNTEAVIPLQEPQIENMTLEMDKISCSMDVVVRNKKDLDALEKSTLRNEATKHQLVNSDKKLKNDIIEELWNHYIKFHFNQLKFPCEESQQQVETTSIRKQLFGDFESDSDLSD